MKDEPAINVAKSDWLFLCSIVYYCIKGVSHAINTEALTSKNSCINQANNVLLMYGFVIYICIRILGRHKKWRHQQRRA